LQESEVRPVDLLPPDIQTGETGNPYFEVLVVTPDNPGTRRAEYRTGKAETLSGCRREEENRHLNNF
jgi:hypothetical protein